MARKSNKTRRCPVCKRLTTSKLCVTCYGYWTNYGLSPESIEALREKQGKLCAICGDHYFGKPMHLHFDKATGAPRGLLCNKCRIGLGCLPTPELIEKAIAYLSAPLPEISTLYKLPKPTKKESEDLDRAKKALLRVLADPNLPTIRAKARALAAELWIKEDAAISRVRRALPSPTPSTPLDKDPNPWYNPSVESRKESI